MRAAEGKVSEYAIYIHLHQICTLLIIISMKRNKDDKTLPGRKRARVHDAISQIEYNRSI